jgi:HPt (histidine-containing phosphotransfer) domain-containing protein
LGITDVVETTTSQVTLPQVKKPDEESDNDYKYQRENFYRLVERGQDAIDGILELAGGEDVVLVELFQSFLKDAKELSEGMKLAADCSDWEKLQFDVHTLKGLSGTIGAVSLFEVCTILNNNLKDGNTKSAIDLSNQVVYIYKELVNHITKNYNV